MRRILLAGLLLLMPMVTAAEEPIPPSPIVKTKLVVNAPSVKRGVAVDAGVTFTMPEHWHIYWQNPGDSGIPTSLEWTLPNGLSAGAIEWPAPERLEMGGLINYGYSNSVTLPVKLTPTHDGVTGDVQVKANWLVCRDICIPESAMLVVPLRADSAGAKAIDAARAKVPTSFNGTATFNATEQDVTLIFTRDAPWEAYDNVRFSPIDDGIMANNPAATVKQVGNELTLTAPRGMADLIAELRGVLHVNAGGKETAWEVAAKNAASSDARSGGKPSPLTGEGLDEGAANRTETYHHTPSPNPLPQGERASPVAPFVPLSFSLSLLFAFLGGIILNIMPCVLPILALKALALSKKAQASRAAAAQQGISYTAGVVISFMLIALGMLALKASGTSIGWGFQLQNAGFVAFLIAVMLLVAANLLGMFELPVLFGEKATGVDDSSPRGSFFTGVLAVLVATPCTAPFMAAAIGATLSMPPAQAIAVFASLGFGMASPFLLISFWPAARRLLPKPGAWMHRFKQLLAIPMIATAIWLGTVLMQLMHPMASNGAHEIYSPAKLTELRASGTPVLVDVTAAWCITCKINERVALKPEAMQQFLREKNVTVLVADWTASDPVITDYLASFGRNGVPLVVYYPPHGEPVILPQVLTPSIVREAIASPAH